MYLATFDEQGNRITSYVVGMHKDIPSDAIPITDEEQALYAMNGGRDYYRGEDGRPVKRPAYVPTLDELKAALRTAINAERDRREQGGFEYQGKVFDSDPTSVIRINAAVNTAVAAVLGDTPFSVNWTAADNTTVTLDAQALLGLSAALAQHSNEQHVQARSLKDQLDQAETEEAVAEVENLLSAWKQEA